MAVAMPAPVELPADCGVCHVEGASVELYDAAHPACRFGLPMRATCTFCGASSQGTLAQGSIDREPLDLALLPSNCCPACHDPMGPEVVDTHRCDHCGAVAWLARTQPPANLADLSQVRARLAQMADTLGHASPEHLLRDHFGCDEASLFAALQLRERIETVADPFAAREAPPARSSERRMEAPPQKVPERSAPRLPEAPASGPALSQPPNSAPPRAIVYPLVSVVAADGELHPKEREIVDTFLRSEGLAPLGDHEFMVHAPASVSRYIPAARREALLQLMCETAAIDGMPDAAEVRVIRAYASAWHIDDARVDFWLWGYENVHASGVRQLWLRLRRFVLSARWEK